MNSGESYQLDIWKGDWGLPSVDIQCLQVLVRIESDFVFFFLSILFFNKLIKCYSNFLGLC